MTRVDGTLKVWRILQLIDIVYFLGRSHLSHSLGCRLLEYLRGDLVDGECLKAFFYESKSITFPPIWDRRGFPEGAS